MLLKLVKLLLSLSTTYRVHLTPIYFVLISCTPVGEDGFFALCAHSAKCQADHIKAKYAISWKLHRSMVTPYARYSSYLHFQLTDTHNRESKPDSGKSCTFHLFRVCGESTAAEPPLGCSLVLRNHRALEWSVEPFQSTAARGCGF